MVMFGCALAISCGIGCNKANLRGDGFGESFTESAGLERPKEKSARPSGFTTKAREIERDFGID
ncbi:MAG: hypothetical protein C0483_15865 [Pirellula sp.]|nr:hypothetical protein [Pirellula sp.]